TELLEEADRLLREPNLRRGRELLPDTAHRATGRPAADLAAVAEHDVSRAGQRQVIRDARADRPGPGDYDPRHGRDSTRRARGRDPARHARPAGGAERLRRLVDRRARGGVRRRRPSPSGRPRGRGAELLGPRAARAAKRLVLERPDGPDTARRIAEQRTSPEGQEGLQAFLERRLPSWRDE